MPSCTFYNMDTFLSFLSWALIAISIISLIAVHIYWSDGFEEQKLTMSIVIMLISFSLSLLFKFAHMDDDSKLRLAEETFNLRKTQNFATYFPKEVATISNAVNEITQHKQKILTLTDNLTGKSQNVSDKNSKKIFESKLQSLEAQESKLNKSLDKLNQCAFEQILMHFIKNLSGEHSVPSDFDNQVHKELKIVEQVMNEVNNIK